MNIEFPKIKKLNPDSAQKMLDKWGDVLGYNQENNSVIIISLEKVKDDNIRMGPNGHCDYHFRQEKIVGVEYKKDIITIVKGQLNGRQSQEMTLDEFNETYFTEAL